MKNRKGESRRFGFLGFKNQADAEAAAKYFNETFINTCKIEVGLAKSFADPSAPKPYREVLRERERVLKEKEERLTQREEKRKKTKYNSTREIDEQIEHDPKLKEFLEATKRSSKVSSWEGVNSEINNSKVENIVGGNSGGLIEHESDNEYEEFKRSGVKRVREEDEKVEKVEQEKEEEQKEEGEKEEKEPTKLDPSMSDLDWLKSRRKFIKDGEEEKEEKEEFETAEPIKQDKEQPEIQQPETEESPSSKISRTGRLFIRNILYTASEDDFRNLFEKYGPLKEVHIAIDTRTNKSKGFVYIQFENPRDAIAAYEELDKQIFQGRFLHILPGQEKKSHKLDSFDLQNMPLKKQRELKKKFAASKETFSWNSLYLNENAVLDAVADKMGISKRDLINPESSGSAVKQALAESHVIGDVRKYFESKSVDLTTFSKKEKDDRIILVKNFPYDTNVNEITELFSEYGDLNRVLFPPTGGIAIVEFKNAPSGRSAFAKLAYTRFKKNMLYLEKGPKDLFTKEPSTEDLEVAKEVETETKNEIKPSSKDLLEPEEEEDVGITSSVFVKNLNFKTTSQNLTELFKESSGFTVAKVSTKPDPKNSGKFLSLGYGFIEFKTKEHAVAFIKSNDNKMIHEHAIQLKLSHRKSSVKKEISKGKKSCKIIVKNLPFEATRKDVFELFKSFGSLKSVRVPKKFNKSARGFAFVEFNLLKEAEHAMDSLKGVHLLGRRLNIDYAEKDGDAEEVITKMTEKMKRQKDLTEYAKASRLNEKKRIEMEEEE